MIVDGHIPNGMNDKIKQFTEKDFVIMIGSCDKTPRTTYSRDCLMCNTPAYFHGGGYLLQRNKDMKIDHGQQPQFAPPKNAKVFCVGCVKILIDSFMYGMDKIAEEDKQEEKT